MEKVNKIVACPSCTGSKVGSDGGPCRNCGGQTQYAVASGNTFTRADGTPCVHEVKEEPRTRTYSVYRCTHCPFYYTFDSGD
jgi:hypothetical protein